MGSLIPFSEFLQSPVEMNQTKGITRATSVTSKIFTNLYKAIQGVLTSLTKLTYYNKKIYTGIKCAVCSYGNISYLMNDLAFFFFLNSESINFSLLSFN